MKKAIIHLMFVLVFSLNAEGTTHSLPGKPTLIRCRSPEKETFTCWWEPGSDGGLPTTYALYYRKENSDTVYECPDYQTAGENSCFFNKNNTSIWVNYNITVVATNELGSTFSDSVDVDVVYIVKPNPPEKLRVVIMEDNGYPFLRVSWEPPHKADTRSGWITLIYEIRVKLEGRNDWEVHLAGQQKMFNIFSLRSGGTYLVQVRCKPDHGFWSEWSSPSQVQVPEYFHQEKSMWITVITFSAIIVFIVSWLLYVNSHSLKHCILPPVPGPKIKGFDEQLLKNGKSEEVLSALMVSNFPLSAPSNYDDILVEYLEVCIPKEQGQLESKDLLDVSFKSECSTSDSDSGRGSCDSHTLLTDKCGATKEELMDEDQRRAEMGAERQKMSWNEEMMANCHENMAGPAICNGRVKTWPSVFSSLPQNGTDLLEQQRSLVMARQHYPSDNLFPPGSASSYVNHPSPGALRPEFTTNEKHPCVLHPQMLSCRKLQSHSNVDISSIGLKRAPAGLTSAALEPANNADAQRVTSELLLHADEPDGSAQMGKYYSKVKGVDRGNMLLLQREETKDYSNQQRHPDGAKGGCHTYSTVTMTKDPASAIRGQTILTTSGYVDTSTMCMLPSH
ncbi:prolactin receptor a [Takifugu flavidus]|nr:prolactin receptor a [Takifugu flavidus]